MLLVRIFGIILLLGKNGINPQQNEVAYVFAPLHSCHYKCSGANHSVCVIINLLWSYRPALQSTCQILNINFRIIFIVCCLRAFVLDVLISPNVEMLFAFLGQMSIAVYCDPASSSSGTLQWTQTAREDSGHVSLTSLDHSHHSSPCGRQPPAFAVASYAEPADPVTTPSTTVPASAPDPNAFSLMHALSTSSALYHP